MDIDEIIPFLKTGEPSAVLRKITTLNETKSKHTDKVVLRIVMAAGFQFEGVPLKIDTEGNAIFSISDGGITYVKVTTVSGVQILKPSMALEILTDGRYFEVPQNAVPTILEVKRNFAKISGTCEKQYGFSLRSELTENGLSSDAEKYQFEQFLQLFEQTLNIIAEDSLGKESLAKLNEIQLISVAERLIVEKQGKRLVLGINFKNKFVNDFKDQLVVALESRL